LLSGHLIERSALRYTPAGLPALDLVIRHESVVEEAGGSRKVTMDLRAVCLGPLTATVQRISPETPAVCAGFLAAGRNGRGTVFHLTGLQTESHPDT
jgi:primosomal replication protein N